MSRETPPRSMQPSDPKGALHPDDLELQRYREGLLDASVHLKVQWHIAACPHCESELERYDKLNSLLKEVGVQLREQTLPDGLQQTLIASVLEAQQKLPVRSVTALTTPRPPDRVTGIFGSLAALSLAGGMAIWPWFKTLDLFSLELSATLKQVAVLKRGVEAIGFMVSDYRLLLLTPTIVMLGLSVMVLARLARRRWLFPMAL